MKNAEPENRYALIYFGLLCLVAEDAFLRSDLFMATPTDILREALPQVTLSKYECFEL